MNERMVVVGIDGSVESRAALIWAGRYADQLGRPLCAVSWETTAAALCAVPFWVRWAGAQVAELEGLGHWWMAQDPRRGAAALGRRPNVDSGLASPHGPV